MVKEGKEIKQMLVSANTLAALAEVSDAAKEVVGEWGHCDPKTTAFLITPDCGDFHISVVDAPKYRNKRLDTQVYGSVTKVENLR